MSISLLRGEREPALSRPPTPRSVATASARRRAPRPFSAPDDDVGPVHGPFRTLARRRPIPYPLADIDSAAPPGARPRERNAVPDGPDATAEQIEDLAALLMDHPFAADQPLLHTIERSVTTGEAQAEARALAAELRALGVEPHQAVAVQLPNGPDVVIAMVGIWLAGAVFVPVNPRLPEAEIEGVLGPSAPAAIIGPEGIRALPDARTYETGTAFILWTSGTTGRPKPILHTHRGYGELLDRVLTPLRAGGAPSTSAQPARPPSPNLIPVSLALNAGIYNALFGLRAGAALVIMDRFETATFAELVRRFEIRSTVLPPAAIAMLNDDPEVTDLSPLRYVRSITSPLSPLQARRFTESFGVFVLNGYGQAEVGEVIGGSARENDLADDFAGRQIADQTLRAGVAERAVKRRPRRCGRRSRRGRRASGPAAEHGEWVCLGDGAIRSDRRGGLPGHGGPGTDRRGRIRLDRGPGRRPSDAQGVPVRDGARRARREPRGDGGDDELVALCRDHLTPYKIPVDFVRVDALPKNEIGKLLRRQLAAGYPR